MTSAATPGTRIVARLAGLVAAIAAVMLPAPVAGAGAAIIPVENTNDAGPESLRQAIIDANGDIDEDVVDATGVTGTIDLQSVLPSLLEDADILGPGAATLTVRRDATAGDFRIFNISFEVAAELSGLTIANGRNTNNISGGAGIRNDRGTVTVRNSVVTGNANAAGSSGGNGGGIVNTGTSDNPGTLTLVDSTVSGNSTQNGNGGGIFNGAGDTVTVRRSTVSGNVQQGGAGCAGGGGIRNQGTLTVTNSTVSGNTSGVGNGGGILTCGAGASSTSIVDSTIASNTSEQAANIGVLSDADDATTVRGTILSDPRGGGG